MDNFRQMSNHKDRPDLPHQPFSLHRGINEGQNSEMDYGPYPGVDLANFINAYEDLNPYSLSSVPSISTSMNYSISPDAQESATPPTQDIHARHDVGEGTSHANRESRETGYELESSSATQHGRAAPYPPTKVKGESKILEPPITRLRRRPKKVSALEGATIVAQPPKPPKISKKAPKPPARAGYPRNAKVKTTTPGAVVLTGPAKQLQEDQFMQLLRDTIESNKKVRNLHGARLTGAQPPISIATTTPRQGTLSVWVSPDSEGLWEPEKRSPDNSEKVPISILTSEARSRRMKRAQDLSTEASIPALEINDTSVVLLPTLGFLDSGTVVSAAHLPNPTAHEMVLASFG